MKVSSMVLGMVIGLVCMGLLLVVGMQFTVNFQEVAGNMTAGSVQSNVLESFGSLLTVAPVVLAAGVGITVICLSVLRSKPDESEAGGEFTEQTGYYVSEEEQEELQANWECGYCGALNYGGQLSCHVCGAPKKKSVKSGRERMVR